MEWLIGFVVVLSIFYYKQRGKDGTKESKKGKVVSREPRRNASGYKSSVKKLVYGLDPENTDYKALYNEVEKMAEEGFIQDFFKSAYDEMCHFKEDEIVLETFFLMVFGDMRKHYVYSKNNKSKRFEPDYREYYDGNKNLNMVISNKYIYFGDNVKGKKSTKLVKIHVSKIKKIDWTADYVEIYINSLLGGERIHNIWCSSGNRIINALLNSIVVIGEDSKETPFRVVNTSKKGYNFIAG